MMCGYPAARGGVPVDIEMIDRHEGTAGVGRGPLHPLFPVAASCGDQPPMPSMTGISG